MPSHLRVPELTGDLPATVSAAALGGLLRGELGFTGVIVSDALEMRAKPGEPIVFDPGTSWSPVLFGKTVPLKLVRKQQVLELELPKDAYVPIDTIVVLRPGPKPSGR
jgi:hypothetical protein